mgnify:CR=1 FL=1
MFPEMASTIRSRRIDVRVTDEQDAIIREAAAAAGQTVTAFLLNAGEERARAILDERRHLVMSDRAFAALADPTRRAVLERLGAGSAAVSELAEPFCMSLTGVKKHIQLLE